MRIIFATIILLVGAVSFVKLGTKWGLKNDWRLNVLFCIAYGTGIILGTIL